jgi:hypothetical protein
MKEIDKNKNIATSIINQIRNELLSNHNFKLDKKFHYEQKFESLLSNEGGEKIKIIVDYNNDKVKITLKVESELDYIQKDLERAIREYKIIFETIINKIKYKNISAQIDILNSKSEVLKEFRKIIRKLIKS